MAKIFVLGDVHGAHKALAQVLERSGFNYDEDTLITLGDICDGWPYVAECVETLNTIKNRIDITGNHDEWFFRYLTTGIHPDQWRQGGGGTLRSYLRMLGKEHMIYNNQGGLISSLLPSDIPQSHWSFFAHQHPFYKDDKNRVFVHGGFYRFKTLIDQRRENPQVFWWDRDLWQDAMSSSRVGKGTTPLKFKAEPISEVFIGHTATSIWDTDQPMHADIVWNVDTGAGWDGRLTIMDVDTHEFWQSDNVKTLYPDEQGR